jgi:hypothetical protein
MIFSKYFFSAAKYRIFNLIENKVFHAWKVLHRKTIVAQFVLLFP